METGWNFDRLDHQQAFLRELDEESPDELLLTPERKLWSRMQTLARRTPAQQEALVAARHHHHHHHHDRHLCFVRRAYLKQGEGGRHAHVEQPKHALCWKTKALPDLPGRGADFDQCRYGDEDMAWRPVKKSATIMTTKQAIQNALTLTCNGDHDHCALEGSALGLGSRAAPRKTTGLPSLAPSPLRCLSMRHLRLGRQRAHLPSRSW